MSLALRRAVIAALTSFSIVPLAAAPARAATPELIMRFGAGADAAERSAARASVEATVVRALPLSGMQLLRIPETASPQAAIARLERSAGVLYAEPNSPRRAAALNDPYFGQLWGLDNTGQTIGGLTGLAGADIDAPSAWELTMGSAQAPVAVVDSGVAADHPDLATQLWTNAGEVAGNGVDDDANGYVDDVAGWDWIGDDATPADANGHGTHVAGTIAARGNDGVGVVGVAPAARVMALRVLDAKGSGDVAGVISAYVYAARAGARVVNLSLGGQSPSQAEREALAAASDVLFVVAAGNGGGDGVGDDNDALGEYPCKYDLPNIVCVAASDNRDTLPEFSNFGATTVDLAAPGVEILSDQPLLAGRARYAYYDGTSMATPHVSGAAALAFALRPSADVATVRTALLAGVDARTAFAGRTVTGGRLNARRALDLLVTATELPPVSTPVPEASATPTPEPTVSATPAPTPDPVTPVSEPAPQPVAQPGDTAAPAQPSPVAQPAVAPVPAGTAPTTSRALPTLTVPRLNALARVRRDGLRMRVVCPERCAATATLSLSARDARRTRLGSGTRSARIGAVRATVPAGRRTLTLRLTPAARRALRHVRGRLSARLIVKLGDHVVRRTVVLVGGP